jgi:mRNA interferase HigB
MRIISKKKIRDFYEANAQSEIPLTEWFYTMQLANSKNFHELKLIFNSADVVKGYTIFNIGGDSYRLIAAIHYNTQFCYVREIWAHAEYSKPHNQAKIQRGEL